MSIILTTQISKMLIHPDEFYMAEALRLAQIAYELKEIPVGAVVVCEGKIIGKGYNQVEQLNDPTAHAEMLAITSACNYLNARHLQDCTLFVSLEPCAMCAGAIAWAQLSRIVFGASDEKRGFMRHQPQILPTKTEISYGVLASESSELVKSFFQEMRKK
ncbi:MAG: tRNA(adenine34) deaminase [Arenicella sp.]